MGTVSLNGSLVGNPQQGGGFPTSTFTSQIALMNGNKLFQNATGVLTRTVDSAAPAYEPLSAIGPDGDVKAADLFYIRTTSNIQLRITQNDGNGGTTVQTVEVQGLFLLEAPTNKQIVLVEVQGTGPIEYFASGV